MSDPLWVRAIARVWRGSSFTSDTFRGSAFQLFPHCLLTAKHVISNCENNLYVTGPSWTGIRKVVKVVEHDTRDVAILYIDGVQSSRGGLLQPHLNPNFERGLASFRGSLAGYADARTDAHIRQATWQSYYGLTNTITLSTAVARGMSGGPFVVQGRAFGVIQGRKEIEGVTYVIPLSAIADFLRTQFGDLSDLRQDDEAGLRVFVQIFNPEMMALHDLRPEVRTIERAAYVYFRYAFLLASDCVIMPASYLFEVAGLSDFLRPLEPLIGEGALQLANPTLNLDSYWDVKQKKEYRDRAAYGAKPDLRSQTSIPIVPRIWRSTSRDISDSWQTGIGDPASWFSTVFARLVSEGGYTPETVEYAFSNLPMLLDNRAFIREFVERALRMPLTPHERLQLAYFLSREYLLSYLREYRAIILNDTTIGRFDCGLPRYDNDGRRLIVSLRELMGLFDRLGIRTAFEQSLTWDGIRVLKAHPVVRRVAEAIVVQDRLAFRAATQLPRRQLEASGSDNEVIDQILEMLSRFSATAFD